MAQSGSTGLFRVGGLLMRGSVAQLAGAGSPTSGTSGTGVGKAGPGSTYFDSTNGILYQNQNTKASPTWVAVSGIADGVVRSAEVAISSAEILALRAAPKTLVAAPGAGKMLQFLSLALILDATATAYTESADNLLVRYENGSGDAVSDVIECTGFIDQTTDQMTVGVPVKDPIVAKAVAENTALVLHNNGDGEFATGTGVLRAKITYVRWATGW